VKTKRVNIFLKHSVMYLLAVWVWDRNTSLPRVISGCRIDVFSNRRHDLLWTAAAQASSHAN